MYGKFCVVALSLVLNLNAIEASDQKSDEQVPQKRLARSRVLDPLQIVDRDGEEAIEQPRCKKPSCCSLLNDVLSGKITWAQFCQKLSL